MESKQYIYIGTEIKEELEKEYNKCQPDQVFILVDAITRLQCLPLLPDLHFLKTARIIEVPAGDDNKTLRSLSDVWLFLSKENASRKSLMINVGGGMITDLGGFAASTFKRGIKYMNIPTTLLGAVDAAVGGKTGINFNGFKNEIGVINPAESVLINVNFFKSLDRNNFLSGYAEMIKHGLISSDEIWNRILGFSLEEIDYEKLSPLLKESVQVKERIVEQDPMEKNIRKALNFGHTAGHAFESYAMEKNEPVLHGYAVAWGMIVELYLSYRKTGLPKPVLHQIVSYIRDTYGSFHITCKQYDKLYEYMTHDKKNEGKGQILFSLLKNIGDIQINVNVDKKDIFDALDFYRDSVGI
jgi:3-dehydroquinate synthase